MPLTNVGKDIVDKKPFILCNNTLLIDFSTIQSQVDSRFAPQGACIKSLSQLLGGMATPVRQKKGETSNNNFKGRVIERKKGFSRLRTKNSRGRNFQRLNP